MVIPNLVDLTTAGAFASKREQVSVGSETFVTTSCVCSSQGAMKSVKRPVSVTDGSSTVKGDAADRSRYGPRLLALRLASQKRLRGRWLEPTAQARSARWNARAWWWDGERTSLAGLVLGSVRGGRRCNRSIWETMVSQSLGGDAYLSMPKDNTRYRAGIGCLDRSTGSVYTVARCGCH